MFSDLLSLIIAVAAFGLVLSIWLVGVLIWSLRRRRRIDELAGRLKLVEKLARGDVTSRIQGGGRVLRLWRDGREATTVVPGSFDPARNLLLRIERFRADAGLESSVEGLVLGASVAVAMAAIVAFLLTSNVMMVVAAPVAVMVLIYILLTQRIAKRQATFERQLIDALDLAARSLRVGHPLVGSFRMIAEEVGAPVGSLFGDVCQQQQLGVSLDEALRAVSAASHSDDLKLFATSVVIQLRSGGNLADMMERLANVIRERNRLARRVRVLTAQTQMSKRVLLAMPFFVFVLLNVISAEYMRPLYTTVGGQMIMAVAGVGLLFGWVTMNWIAKIEA